MSDDEMFVAALAREPALGGHLVDGWGRGGAAARPSSGALAALQGLRGHRGPMLAILDDISVHLAIFENTSVLLGTGLKPYRSVKQGSMGDRPRASNILRSFRF